MTAPTVPEQPQENVLPFITVGGFLDQNRKSLAPGVVEGPGFLERRITRKRLQKLGLALAGFTDYLQEGRVYVFGNTEYNYLEKQPPDQKTAMVERLRPECVTCILVSHALSIPTPLAEHARKKGIPVLTTQLDSSTAMYLFTEFLETELARKETIHGVLMDIFGVGTLIIGESGIGKSECALELVLKGHRIVADDLVEIRIIRDKLLHGSAPAHLQEVLELRGIGIINVRELIGISAIRRNKIINFLIELERWTPQSNYERIGLDMLKKELFGVELPFMAIPVAPGRSLASLVEIACRVYLIRSQGMHPMGDFLRFIEQEGETFPGVGGNQ